MSTHGQNILSALRAEMTRLGRKPSDVESAFVIDGYLVNNSIKLKRAKKSDPKPRARDAIFDLLAKIDGQELAKITRNGGSRIAGAKKQILEVLPGQSTDQVCAEIEARAGRYRRKHPTRELTAMALVTWWAELGAGPATQSAAANLYIEPAGDWRRVMSVVCKIDATALADKAWLDIGVDYRRAVLNDMTARA